MGRDGRGDQVMTFPVPDELFGIFEPAIRLGRVDHRKADNRLAEHAPNTHLGDGARHLVFVVVHVRDRRYARQGRLHGSLARSNPDQLARQ